MIKVALEKSEADLSFDDSKTRVKFIETLQDIFTASNNWLEKRVVQEPLLGSGCFSMYKS